VSTLRTSPRMCAEAFLPLRFSRLGRRPDAPYVIAAATVLALLSLHLRVLCLQCLCDIPSCTQTERRGAREGLSLLVLSLDVGVEPSRVKTSPPRAPAGPGEGLLCSHCLLPVVLRRAHSGEAELAKDEVSVATIASVVCWFYWLRAKLDFSSQH